jgi:hypothetical protein
MMSPRPVKTCFLREALFLLLGTGSVPVVFAQSPAAPAYTGNASPAPAATSSAATSPAIPADPIPELHVGQDVYYDVKVTQVTPLTLVFIHRHGIASVALTDLPADLQTRFGYDPAKAAAELARRQAENSAHKVAANLAPGDKGPPALNAQQILQRFGQPPKIFQEVNMQPRFDHLGVGVKNQGPRPSCAVFAIVSAMEYECAPLDGPAPEYSEEYLIWATLKTLGKTGLAVPKNQESTLDMGFALTEVAEALRAYGMATAAELPYHFVLTDPHLQEPSEDVIASAKKRTPVDGYYITGREPRMQISNIVQVINAGVPVIIGLNWPEQKDFSDNVLLDDQPGLEKAGHAVLLVSYRNKTGKLEDMEFLFKNSYGVQWGDRGYGVVTYKYLLNNLHDALFLVAH